MPSTANHFGQTTRLLDHRHRANRSNAARKFQSILHTGIKQFQTDEKQKANSATIHIERFGISKPYFDRIMRAIE